MAVASRCGCVAQLCPETHSLLIAHHDRQTNLIDICADAEPFFQYSHRPCLKVGACSGELIAQDEGAEPHDFGAGKTKTKVKTPDQVVTFPPDTEQDSISSFQQMAIINGGLFRASRLA